jgi:hypothetical protein
MKVHVCWVNLIKNQIIQNFPNFQNLNERLAKQKTHFFHHWTKKYDSMGSNFLALGVSQMCEKKSCEKTCLVVH